MTNKFGIVVEMRGPFKKGDGYRLKVSCVPIGMYIDGFTAKRSVKNNYGWWIQPPARMYGGKYIKIIEFNTHLPFWQCIEDMCVEVVLRTEDENFIVPEESINDIDDLNKLFDSAIERADKEDK